MPSALRKTAPVAPVTRPVSIAGLAERLGVPRQRVYNLVRRGQVKAEPLSGNLVIQPEEALRVSSSTSSEHAVTHSPPVDPGTASPT
jgi:hypothetical protein